MASADPILCISGSTSQSRCGASHFPSTTATWPKVDAGTFQDIEPQAETADKGICDCGYTCGAKKRSHKGSRNLRPDSTPTLTPFNPKLLSVRNHPNLLSP